MSQHPNTAQAMARNPEKFQQGGRYRFTPQQCHRINNERLRATWRELGHVCLRFMPQIRIEDPRVKYCWGSLLGATWRVDLPEATDVYDLIRDLRRFLVAWRPMRTRSASGQARATAVLNEWEALSK